MKKGNDWMVIRTCDSFYLKALPSFWATFIVGNDGFLADVDIFIKVKLRDSFGLKDQMNRFFWIILIFWFFWLFRHCSEHMLDIVSKKLLLFLNMFDNGKLANRDNLIRFFHKIQSFFLTENETNFRELIPL